jgi:hypothetical protein
LGLLFIGLNWMTSYFHGTLPCGQTLALSADPIPAPSRNPIADEVLHRIPHGELYFCPILHDLPPSPVAEWKPGVGYR